MGTDFTVVAIIAAYNEGDVIGQVVSDLIGQGVCAYLLDHGSTDDTVARTEPYLGRGLLGIERFPLEGTGVAPAADQFCWESILRRKEVLAAELEADWFIHHDADELRESPWAHLDLHDAIRTVDELGYNAIDFELLDFWPTHDGFRPGDDMRQMFRYYAPGAPWNKVQIRCWKKTPDRVDLASSGGHEALFPNRRVFPLRFILRHYPIRSQTHGERKVFRERRARFAAAELAKGWHVQYNAMLEGQNFLRDPTTMTPYDPAAVRLQLILRHRGVEALEESLAAERRSGEAAGQELEKIQEELAARSREATALEESLAAERRSGEAVGQELEKIQEELAARSREAPALEGSLAAERRSGEAAGQELEKIQGELAARSSEVTALEMRVEELKSELEGARRDLDRLTVELAGRLHDNEALRNGSEALRRQLEVVYASRSWRWTAPMRAAFRLIGRR